ncbi:MAG: NUDIX domain-containing protein [Patescibacteria group bacterium]
MYENPRPSSGLIFFTDRNEILLLKRSREPRSGAWGIPAGFVDQQESFEESAVREVREELGIYLKTMTYFRSYADIYDYQGVTLPILTAIFCAQLAHDVQIKLDAENSEYAFFKFEDIPFHNFGFQSHSQSIHDFINEKNKII